MTDPPQRFSADMRQHLIDAAADYFRALKESAQADLSERSAVARQLVEAVAAVNRATVIGPVLIEHIGCIIGALPEPPPPGASPEAAARHQDDMARWVVQAAQILIQDFLKPSLGGSLLLDAWHNETERALAGDPLLFFRPITPKHGNTKDVFQRTARDAAVYATILAAAELEGSNCTQRVLDQAAAGIGNRAFIDMRQNVGDKDALARITAEAKRRRHNRQIKQDMARRASRPLRGRPAKPRPERLMAPDLIAGSLSDAEKMALYPDQYDDLARFATMEERIGYLFGIWSRGQG